MHLLSRRFFKLQVVHLCTICAIMAVDIQRCSYDISLRFTINNISSYLENGAESKTGEFAQGWQYSIKGPKREAILNAGNNGLWLYLVPPRSKFQKISVWFSLSVTSLSGVLTYCEVTKTITFKTPSGKGVCIVRLLHFNNLPLLRQENAVVVNVTLKAPSKPNPRSGLPFGLIHKALKSSNTDGIDVCFNVYSHRSGSGTLTQPTILYATTSYLKGQCKVLEDGKD